MAFGILALKINIRYLASVAFMAQIIAMVMLLTLKELVLIYIYSALLGISVGALVAALPTFIGAYFGRARYSKVMGLVLSFHVGAYAIGGAIAGFIYDATASYAPAFVIVIAFSLIGLISVFIARPLK
jgi:MFS family permease